MRHGKKLNHLSRKSEHRKAMMSNLASSLVLNKRIHTTLPKAKALRKYVEPLITKSKSDNTHSRREAFKHLMQKEAVKELFITVADKVGDRPGGYTRILKLGPRLGDNAEMAMMELVDFNENLLEEQRKSKGRSRRGGRRRRGGKKSQKSEEQTETTEATVESGSSTEESSEVQSTDEVSHDEGSTDKNTSSEEGNDQNTDNSEEGDQANKT